MITRLKKPLLTFGLLTLIACATFAPVQFSPSTIVIHAQTLPITRTLAWTQTDAITANVTSYRVVLDAATPISVLPCAPDPATCQQPLTFTTAGAHTVTVVAVGLWGDSATASLAVNVVLPGKATSLTIK